MPFQVHQHPFLGEIILWYGLSSDPRKVQVLMNMPPPSHKNELQSFLGILNYLSKFSPMTAEICKLLQKLMLAKAEWMWNGMYQDLYCKDKKIIKQDTCMKFYDILNTSVPRNEYMWHSSWGWIAAGKRRYELWM